MVNAYLASTNKHKVEEIQELVSAEFLNIDLPPEKLEVVEDGEDFHANALLKAKAYYEKFGCPALADDSGIVVEALPDELGVKSARFGGEDLPSDKKNELLLERLQGVENRKAYYVCVLCLYVSPQEQFFFEGRLHGNIAHAPEGSEGFGYDPLFVAEGQKQSIATMGEWKAKHSHRAKACKQMEKFLQGHEK